MPNEMILVVMMLILYGAVLLWYALFGEKGLYCFTVLATIAANIEVLIVIDAFGMEQTLGNILFACTFLITDMLSETAGKKAAATAVKIGIAASLTFIIISQSWLLYTPNGNDWAFPSIQAVFRNTPRLMLVSLAVYAICQSFDVWLYHKWWDLTTRIFGERGRFLWLRNNGSTLLSQLLNTLLFTLGAFWGIYDGLTLFHIVCSSYVIFVVTSLADTPFVYLARKIKRKRDAAVAPSSGSDSHIHF